MNLSTANLVSHNNSSKQTQQQKEAEVRNLWIQIITSWNRGSSSALGPNNLCDERLGACLGGYVGLFLLEQQYLNLTLPYL